ncbi:ABC transporter permease [Grimontia hollisae]|uniref:Peptide ABC transporter permease protein n=1 Tax=Grimontia hollisae CIP 101886 TaxID=675812 RepID=D0I9C6_GRIHO|nr:ABC transporter permease [Grimontia hollisae]AMG29398.1 ABC transporter permease [Grimontia hollisae]EEY72041.1 peptide ABC transporter permease protein [Grimontia hollisae CIP 101886]STO77580.1 Probable D,D-dipeptide transport system permease protein ddpC [Grimontia hollisae]
MTNLVSSGQKAGLFILLLLFSFSLFTGLFSPYSIDQQNLSATLLPPNSDHWLGTDHFGRDMATRLASAIGLSFSLSLMCVITASILGISLGVLSAWAGGKTEQVLDIIVNILLALPGLVLVLLLAAIAPGSFVMLYVAISLVQWVEYYRVTRAITRTQVGSPERELSAMMGFGKWYQFKRHILPAILPSVITMAAFGGANAVLMMASLGFVSVGIQPPLAELGLMSVELFPYSVNSPWALAQPLVAVALLVLGFHLLTGTGRETIDSTE